MRLGSHQRSNVAWACVLFAGIVALAQTGRLGTLRAEVLDCSSQLEAEREGRRSKVASVENASLLPLAAPPTPPPLSCALKPPRVLMVTAEQPMECSTATAQWLGARSMRNRLTYCQRHRWQLYWNTDTVDPTYAGIVENPMWNKVRGFSAFMGCPSSRLRQPALLAKLLNSSITEGVEWLFWIDSDAIIMDIDFALPLDQYERDNISLVLWGEPRMVDEPYRAAPSYFGLNAGVMLMRNNDWTRRFLGEILKAGADVSRATETQRQVIKGFCDRAYDCVASDQSTIVYLLHTQAELWRKETLFEKRCARGCAGRRRGPLTRRSFTMNGHWQEYAGHLVSGSLRLQDSIWSSDRVPFVMHFAGCQLCSGKTDAHYANWDACRVALGEALSHVEDYSLAKLGLHHKFLNGTEVETWLGGPPSYPKDEAEAEAAGAGEKPLGEGGGTDSSMPPSAGSEVG